LKVGMMDIGKSKYPISRIQNSITCYHMIDNPQWEKKNCTGGAKSTQTIDITYL
jgi:hypothetical protein